MFELHNTTDLQAAVMLALAVLLFWAVALMCLLAWETWRMLVQQPAKLKQQDSVTKGWALFAKSPKAQRIGRQLAALRSVGMESMLVLVTCIHFALWQLLLESHERNRLSVWPLVVGGLGSVALWRWLHHHPGTRAIVKQSLALFLSGCQIAGLVVLSTAYSWPHSDVTDPPVLPGEVVTKTDWFALTDQGHRIELCERQLSIEKFAKFVEQVRPQIASLAQQAIRRNQAVIDANCHGWVFAKGQHIVRTNDVLRILSDNGYVMQSCPQVGDVALYKSDEGKVLHTGVVCGSTDDGQVLVESKWGIEGCFVHMAEQQPYSQNITYWRSPRASHALKMFHASENGEPVQVHPTEATSDIAVLDD